MLILKIVLRQSNCDSLSKSILLIRKHNRHREGKVSPEENMDLKKMISKPILVSLQHRVIVFY